MNRCKRPLVLCIALAIFILLPGCNPWVSSANDRSTYPQAEETEGTAVDDAYFVLEPVGISGPFKYYRDTITDVLYITYSSGGLTVMMDPETGLPMTYSQYLAKADSILGNIG